MKYRITIKGFILFICCAYGITNAQTDKSLLPFSNKLLLNPSFAGLNKNTSVWTGLYFQNVPNEAMDHEFFLTYDTYSEKLKGGIAFYFYQGLEGKMNTITTGTGITYSKLIRAGESETITPSFNINFRAASKQWFVSAIDGILNKQFESPSPPGKEFMRYTTILPRLGILWETPSHQTGFSASWPFQRNLAQNVNSASNHSPEIIFHYTHKRKGFRRGLKSQPFRATPELIIRYSNEVLLTRAGITLQRVNNTYSIFLQNNFVDNLHGMGGTYGWRFDNFSLNLLAGTAFNTNSQNQAFFGEVSLGLIIPYIHFDEKKPWAPPKKSF